MVMGIAEILVIFVWILLTDQRAPIYLHPLVQWSVIILATLGIPYPILYTSGATEEGTKG